MAQPLLLIRCISTDEELGMANSSLDRTGERTPVTWKGHGTEALGPSDSSDTGSDITGAPGLDEESSALDLQTGTTSDLDHNPRGRRKTAGPDVGDENLDSDTDAGGTGERGAAGRDAPPPTDQQLDVEDMSGIDIEPDDDLPLELVDEDRELGDEAAPDVFEEEDAEKRENAGDSGRRRR